MKGKIMCYKPLPLTHKCSVLQKKRGKKEQNDSKDIQSMSGNAVYLLYDKIKNVMTSLPSSFTLIANVINGLNQIIYLFSYISAIT